MNTREENCGVNLKEEIIRFIGVSESQVDNFNEETSQRYHCKDILEVPRS